MFQQSNQSFDDMMKPGKEAFEYWISFFPTAPLFGVEWRFGELMPAPYGGSKATKQKAASTKTKPKTKTAANSTTEAASEVRTTPQTAPSATVKETVTKVKASTAKTETTAKTVPATAKAARTASASKPAKPAGKAKEQKPVVTKPKPKGPAILMAEKPAKSDDLKLIKGIGPGLEKELNGLGLYRFNQMAKLSEADLKWIDARLTAFKGRCFRDDWTGQASKLLA